MSEWQAIAIAELALGGEKGVAGGPFGSSLGRKHYVQSGVPVIRGSQLAGDGQFSFKDLVFVSEEKADRHTGNLARPGDVLVTQRGTLGQVGLIPDSSPYERFLLSQSQMKVTTDPAIADASFLYLLLSAPEVNRRLTDQAVTTGVPHINLATLRGFEVSLPRVKTQRRIAAILFRFNQLIEVSERRIEVLAGLVRSLYREWFVRFQFPGNGGTKLVDSELGSVPRGWRVKQLDEISDIVMGQSPKSKFYNEDGDGLPFHQGVTNYGALLPTHRKYCTVEGRVAHPGDVLLSVRAPVGRLNIADQRLVIGRGLSAIRRHDDRQTLLLEQLRWGMGEENSLGGGTIFKAIGKKELGSLPILEAVEPINEKFEAIARPMLDACIELTFQVRCLVATRDLLLPRLVTGRLDTTELGLDWLLADGEAA